MDVGTTLAAFPKRRRLGEERPQDDKENAGIMEALPQHTPPHLPPDWKAVWSAEHQAHYYWYTPGIYATWYPPSIDNNTSYDGAAQQHLTITTQATRLRFDASIEFGRRLLTESLLDLVTMLKNPDRKVAFQDALILIQEGSKHLCGTNAVRYINVPPGGRVVVLGDTHGQLLDFFWILMQQGLPSGSTNVYLLNGDVADRGPHAVEILLLLLAFKLHDPASVYLNRGNHEDAWMNKEYGFRDECIRKYGRFEGEEIYVGFEKLFNTLPLCSVVNAGGPEGARAFVAHAGIPRVCCSLSRLQDINFCRPVPTELADGDDQLFYDLLWSDPFDDLGIGPNSRGDNIMSFGPDVTRAFVEANGLSYVIRSHDVPDDNHGFEWRHDGKLVTVFSGSNYNGSGNTGAVIAITAGDAKLRAVEHWASSFEELWEKEALENQACLAEL